jgi:hypothetical protein
LDCRNYARAAASMLLYDNFNEAAFEALEAGYGKREAEKPTIKKKRSSFWD